MMKNRIIMKHKQDEKSRTMNTSSDDDQEKMGAKQSARNNQDIDKNNLKADALYQFLKPLHNLPRGKNTWDPQFIKKWWFWPLSALLLIILFYVYPYIWDFFAS
jgi:hypothetical protein